MCFPLPYLVPSRAPGAEVALSARRQRSATASCQRHVSARDTGAMANSEAEVQAYLDAHKIQGSVEEVINECVKAMAPDPHAFMAARLRAKAAPSGVKRPRHDQYELSVPSSGLALECTHTDAFSSTPFGGNPACVVVLPAADDPKTEAHANIDNEEWMQKVAREMHLSETSFLMRLTPSDQEGPPTFRIRWFTPGAEVDLCGHATLASSHVLWSQGHVPFSQPITFECKSGALRATRTAEGPEGEIELDFPEEPLAPIAEDDEDRARLCPAFGLAAEEVLYVGRNRMDLVAEVTPEAFARLAVDMSAVSKIECRVLSVTAVATPASLAASSAAAGPGGQAYDFVSRYFAPLVGVPEDPVCGSAHCALGPYWLQKLEPTLGGRAALLTRACSARGGDVRVRVGPADGDGRRRVVLSGQARSTMCGLLLA